MGRNEARGQVHVALLAISVLLVAVNWEISDIAVVRWRETVGDTDFEYPVLARAIYLGERAITGSRTGIGVLNALFAVVLAVAVTRALRHAGADVGLWALAPTLVLVGQNVDALTALLIALTVVAWHDGVPARAGVLAGAGAALKVSPAVVLPPLLASATRQRGLRLVLAAAATWLLVNLPYALAHPTAWAFPYRFASERDDVRGTVWAALPLGRDTINVLSAATTVVLLITVAAAVRWRRMTPLTGVALSLLAFMAGNKVWQPHYLLWLLPVLALLHAPRRPVRAFETANLAFFVAFWLKLDDSESGALYWLSGTARLVTAVWLALALVGADRLVTASREAVTRPGPAPAGPAPPPG